MHNRFIILYSRCIRVIDLPLILFNTSRGIYAIPKETKHKSIFRSVKNETQSVPLLFLLLRFMTYAPSFIRDKLFLGKMQLNLDSYLK